MDDHTALVNDDSSSSQSNSADEQSSDDNSNIASAQENQTTTDSNIDSESDLSDNADDRYSGDNSNIENPQEDQTTTDSNADGNSSSNEILSDSSSYLSTAQVFDDHTTTNSEGLNHNIAQVYDVTSSESASDPDDGVVDENRRNEDNIPDNNDFRDEPEEDDSHSQSTTSSQYIEQERRGNRNFNLQNADIDTLSESTFRSGNEISTNHSGSVYTTWSYVSTSDLYQLQRSVERAVERPRAEILEQIRALDHSEFCPILELLYTRQVRLLYYQGITQRESERERERLYYQAIIDLRREQERIRAQQVEQDRERTELQRSFHLAVQVLLAYLSVAFCVAMKGFMDSDHYAAAIRHHTVLAWSGELASKEPASQSVLCL